MTDAQRQNNRQVYLEWLYERSQRGVPDADGNPHPMHDKYTGLYQDRAMELIRQDAVIVMGGDV
jgi:hypothetical protein